MTVLAALLTGTGSALVASGPAAAATAPASAVQTTTPAPGKTTPPASGDCVTGALLVPSCGVLWGAAAGGFTSAPRDQELKDWE